MDKTLIECYRCKKMFKEVKYSGKDEDYKQKKWFCEECFGYEKCKAKVEKILDKSFVRCDLTGGAKNEYNKEGEPIVKEIMAINVED